MSLKVSFSLWQTSSLDQHRYLLNVVPAEVSIPHCVVSGELAATVGQYIALLIALRVRFGNVCTDAQTRDMAYCNAPEKIRHAMEDEFRWSNLCNRSDPLPSACNS